ncbi:serine/arginine repetitive matrix protein 1-like isoform X7 [Penaeus japonicus]|uniref:serine/arginine repetitive matrix protein 1-like isoform X7 n=1 Tax=Penaeus japonicus TaxID=27405 RepID=UPI001C7164AE|nr:serine/arginine repetitive matrix protein 1-like isoform X7 [Penaeus japonicus]
MANQQFCLRWNNYQSNLTQVFDQLLQAESFVDVTLSCEGNSVKAHRMVLSACSPYFQGLLSDAPCSHPVIILQGVKWPELKAVVEFMYKGEINICQEQLGSLLRVAESLKIRGLAEVDGDGGESAVLTSPAASPAARPLHPSLDDSSISPTLAAIARKRRRLSGDDMSRPCTPATPTSAPELLDTVLDLPPPLGNRGGSAPLPGSPAGLSSLAAHLPGPMPPPAPMPHHLPHLPPLSPLLNMHHIHRHHTPDDFEIRPGIAEMIREEERVRILGWSPPLPFRPDNMNQAKLLESSHHWMGTSMADGGGPVFPSMFPDPPNNSKASKIAGSSSKAASATSKTVALPLPKVQQPPPAPPPPSSAPATLSPLNPLAKQDTSNAASKAVTHKISITSVVSCNNSLPANTIAASGNVMDNTVSITAAARKPGLSVVSPEPKVITITTSAITGGISSPAAAPHQNRGHSNNMVTPTRGPSGPGRLAGKAALDGAWENLHGAVSAPKSGASRWTQSDLVAALALVKAGTPIKPAAERCNIPVMTLWRRTRALGIVSSKVQCGFRYPAGRGRSKTEPDHNTVVKCENEDALPFKNKHENAYPAKSEPRLVIQPKIEPQDSSNGKEVIVQRAGPLREMSALHALCRVASRENSPRPLGRENSPLPLGRENSPKPIGRENSPKTLGRENSLKPLGRENSPRPFGRENSPRPFGRENSPRPLGRENSPRLLSRENSPRPFGRENSPRPLGRESIPRPPAREGSPLVLGRESSPRPPAGREKALQMNVGDSPSPEFKDPRCQQQTLEESPSPLVTEKSHSESSSQPPSLKDEDNSNLDVSEKEGSPRPPPRGPMPAGGADRFRAWVDIVLEGAGRHHQQEIPQDLSTRHQRPSQPSPPHSQPTSSCPSTAASATAPQNTSPSPLHE